MSLNRLLHLIHHLRVTMVLLHYFIAESRLKITTLINFLADFLMVRSGFLHSLSWSQLVITGHHIVSRAIGLSEVQQALRWFDRESTGIAELVGE